MPPPNADRPLPGITVGDPLYRGMTGTLYRAVRNNREYFVKVPPDASDHRSDNRFREDALHIARLGLSCMPKTVHVSGHDEPAYVIFEAWRDEVAQQTCTSRQTRVSGCLDALQTLVADLSKLHSAGFAGITVARNGHAGAGHPPLFWLADVGDLYQHHGGESANDGSPSFARAAEADYRALAARFLEDCSCMPRAVVEALRLLHAGEIDLVQFAQAAAMRLSPEKAPSNFPPPEITLKVEQGSRGCRLATNDLHEAYAAAQRGETLLVGLSGACGSGKSELLARFADELSQQGALVLCGACQESDWRPFALVRRIFEDHMTGRRSLSETRQQELTSSLVAAAGPMLPWLGMLVPQFAKMAKMAKERPALPLPGDAHHSFISGVAGFLQSYLHDNGPAVILVDDCQWIEASSMRVLSRSMGGTTGTGALFVVAHNGTDEGVRSETTIAQMCRGLEHRSIELKSLTASEAAHLIGESLGDSQPPSPNTVQQLLDLSDGTPLSLLNIVGHALEAGTLSPAWGHWQLDLATTSVAVGSRDPVEFACRKIGQLPLETRTLLTTLSVAGSGLSTDVLASVHGLPQARVMDALAPADHSKIIECKLNEAHFRSDAERRAASLGLSVRGRALEHVRLASVLERRGSEDPEFVCEIARHFASAGAYAPAAAGRRAAVRAARYCQRSHDHHRTLFFLDIAESMAQRDTTPLNYGELADLAESCWQNGQVDRSHDYFARAAQVAPTAVHEAATLGQLAWVQHYAGRSDDAAKNLKRGLSVLSWNLPRHRSPRVLALFATWAHGRLGQPSNRPGRGNQEQYRAEVVCDLLLKSYRILAEIGMTADGLVAQLSAECIARSIGPCEVASRTLSSSAGVMTLLGLRGQTEASLADAEHIARQVGSPIALARCEVMRHVVAAWQGEVDRARQYALSAADTHGHFVDLGDYCLMCLGMVTLETIVGRPESALSWLQRLINRAILHGQAPAITALAGDAARAILATLGREEQLEGLRRDLTLFEAQQLPSGVHPHLLSYQFRIQHAAELGQLGPKFDALIQEFILRAEQSVAPVPLHGATYAHILHARIHQGIRSGKAERRRLAKQLSPILQHVDKVARGSTARAHETVGRAAQRWFLGRDKDALRLLDQAEAQARQGPCIWVMYVVARLRAHLFREQGRAGAALEQARQAASLAHRHHHLNRHQWMVEDFGVGVSQVIDPPTLPTTDNRPTRGHLDTLLSISRTGSADLSPDRQSSIILDEIARSLGADQGFLLLPSHDELLVAASFGVGSIPAKTTAPLRGVVEAAYGSGQLLRLETGQSAAGDHRPVEGPTLAASLVLRGKAIGVLYLERTDPKASFTAEEAELVLDLSSQAPIALELAKSLRERNALEENLRQAQKLEAIGQLAGGIAHDFNNLLSTIELAGCTLQESIPPGGPGSEELTDILDVASRGSALTKQLLAFAKRERTTARALNLNESVHSLTPILRRLLGSGTELRSDLDLALPKVMADHVQVEQVLLNLVTNARDAMHGHGTISVRTAVHVQPTDAAVEPTAAIAPGRYVELSVQDDGPGMPADVQQRVFEPFYTTKAGHRGTGLGLSTVYGIVKQHGGHIALESTLGVGTTFTVYWPTMDHEPESTGDPLVDGARDATSGHIVVMPPASPLRAELCDALTSVGLDVVTVDGPDELPELVEELGDSIRRVIYPVPPSPAELTALYAGDPTDGPAAAIVFGAGTSRVDLTGPHIESHPVPDSVQRMLATVQASLRRRA